MTFVLPRTARPETGSWLVERLLGVPVVAPAAPRQSTLAPFDGQPLVGVPYSTGSDVDRAFDTARTAQVRWAQTPVRQRARQVLAFHDLLLQHRDEGLDLIQWETGKPRMDAFKELLGVCAIARYYARRAERLLAPQRARGVAPVLTRVHVLHHPVGVVGVISPWNYPLFLAVADAIPALMAGNAVVLKPDHQTPLTALWVVDLLHRAGIPPRVLQVVLGPGPELGPQITARADHLMFTGSTAVGRTIAAACGQRLVGCSLELGGKNPMIVAADADVRAASEIALRACFDNAGQLCVSIERIYVVSLVYDSFVEQLLGRISGLRMVAEVGWEGTYGSLISQGQLDRVTGIVDDAVRGGATVLTGGRALPEVGPYYFAPTLLTGVREGMAAFREETFGPVVALERVSDEDEAVRRANDSPYGLNASIVVGDAARGVALGQRVRAGSVNVNEAYEATFGSAAAPMGGMGASGMGRRNGEHGLLRFTEPQTIAVQRGIGFGTPYGMAQRDWATGIATGFAVLKRLGMP